MAGDGRHPQGFEIRPHGSGFVVTFSCEHLDADTAVRAIEGLRDAGVGPTTPYVVYDMLQPTSFDRDITDLHRVVVRGQIHLAFDKDARVAAAVGPAGFGVMTAFLEVRASLAMRTESSQPPYQLFGTLDEAIAWASGGD